MMVGLYLENWLFRLISSRFWYSKSFPSPNSRCILLSSRLPLPKLSDFNCSFFPRELEREELPLLFGSSDPSTRYLQTQTHIRARGSMKQEGKEIDRRGKEGRRIRK